MIRKNTSITIFLLSIVMFVSCSSDRSVDASFSLADNLTGNELEEFENDVSRIIGEYINFSNDSSHIAIGAGQVFVSDELIQLYHEVDYRRVWNEEKNRQDAVEIIEASYYEGLQPEDYHAKAIKKLLSGKKQTLQDEAIRLAHLDILLTDAIMLYAFHIIQGKVDPHRIDPNWNYSRKDIPDDVELRLLARLQEKSLKDSAASISPALQMYSQYKKWFIHYDSLQKNDLTIMQLEYPGKSLRLGDTSDVVIELKHHLKNFDANAVFNHDAIFDEELEAALVDFQKYFGLTADGIAGESTFEALNTTVEERLNMIRVNMERCRWIHNLPPKAFLLVNIADFHLYIFRNGEIDYSSRVVVGKEHHETPVFTSDIQYVVFNPTWTVPYSIATKETLPRLQKDPNYLQNRNMTLLRNGVEVNPSTVDFSQYSINNFPFTIRQEPGIYNALGRMKFIFPNKYSVYLHDTPSKSYFSKSERTFSHGCVRVENPHLLAEQLLVNKGYDQVKIKEVLNTEKETVVHLQEPMKVMLMYWTSYEDMSSGKMYFYQDVYNRDEKILDALLKSRSN